ncbi:response regulator [Altererythrobacter sp. KTW20L]|uniref:response regulator n=1 Tax=Altererythrobacter sp. KTW20L TaxID=2942210 RepID=UPI0020C0EA4F|nr:response regulator [Altererythrobacter sp. KTW20L]MCL6252071.1 response regulator [Altererythrobacter sp. KTW20L]
MNGLAGKRILVVEDEFFIAEMTSEMLTDWGATVVGPAYTLAEAKELAENRELDAAVLDMNLHGDPVDAIADALNARGVPFVYVTGYAGVGTDPVAAPVLGKPIDGEELRVVLLSLMANPA